MSRDFPLEGIREFPSRIPPWFGGPYKWVVSDGHYSLQKAEADFIDQHKEMYQA